MILAPLEVAIWHVFVEVLARHLCFVLEVVSMVFKYSTLASTLV